MEPFETDESGSEPNEPTNGDDTSVEDGAEVENDDDTYEDEDDAYEDEDDAYEDDEDDDEDDDTYDDDEDDDDDADETADGEPRDRRASRPRDARADKAHDFLARVLNDMGMDVSVRRRRPRPESSPDEINLEIVGRDVGRVIGKKGQVLAALQYLVNRVTNRPGLPRRHVVLDAEGYRHRRETTLATMARRLGEQAVKEGKIITFEPMSPRDRRVVHLALAKFPNVVTKSDGEGDERRVRIIPVRR
jgi:spoIIIJ-associated protein